MLEDYVRSNVSDVRYFPPRFPLYTRSKFIKDVFYKYAHKGAMIVCFNLPFDLSRITIEFSEGTKNEWVFDLLKNSDGSDNPLYPAIGIDPIDSKKAFISFWNLPTKMGNTKIRPSKIGDSRFLDLRTLLWALFNKRYSLKLACDNEKGPFKGQNLPPKKEDGATGKVTIAEIDYARQDGRCTAALLNAAKQEFDLHSDLKLDPDKAYSTASIAKAYLEAMEIKRPSQKFNMPNEFLAIAMEAFTGGRAETKLRLSEVPVVAGGFHFGVSDHMCQSRALEHSNC